MPIVANYDVKMGKCDLLSKSKILGDLKNVENASIGHILAKAKSIKILLPKGFVSRIS